MIGKTIATILAGMACLLAGTAGGQDYPSKPILIIAPFSPGTAVDFVGRLIARSLGEQFKVGAQLLLIKPKRSSRTLLRVTASATLWFSTTMA